MNDHAILCIYPVVLKYMLSPVFFTRIADRSPLSVAISPSGSTTAGETYSLVCSATLHDRNPAGSPNSYIMPPPTFEWSFGPNGNAPLPSGMTATTTVFNSNNRAYTSTLQFSPLSQSHEGNYTCRLGVVSLVNSHNFTVVGTHLTRNEALCLLNFVASV